MDIRAQNDLLRRMFCTLGTGMCLFSGDAQIARTAYSISRTLSYLYCATQIRS